MMVILYVGGPLLIDGNQLILSIATTKRLKNRAFDARVMDEDMES